MVNNTQNINKANNHLSHQIIENKAKVPRHIMVLQVQVLARQRHTNMAGLNQSLGSQSSNERQHIYKKRKKNKTCTDSLPVEKITCHHKKLNDNIWYNNKVNGCTQLTDNQLGKTITLGTKQVFTRINNNYNNMTTKQYRYTVYRHQVNMFFSLGGEGYVIILCTLYKNNVIFFKLICF